MTDLETFAYELKQYLNLGLEKRTLYGATFYQNYLKQAASKGISEEEAVHMMERLVSFMAASDGEINRSEYEFCNNALFEKNAEQFMNMCKKNMLSAETAKLREFAKKQFEYFGHKSCFYIIALFIIAANGECTRDEQKRLCQLFGLIK